MIKDQLQQTPAFRNECGFLSNFSPYQRGEFHNEDGISYPTNEHYYQAQKFDNRRIRQKIALHPSQGLKRFARTCGLIVANWDQIKIGAMRTGLNHKFSIPRYQALLLGTGDYHLEEKNTWGDTFWGTVNSKGENWLGKLLMEQRDKLKQP